MMTQTFTSEPLMTVDVRELNSLRWGPLRDMFPEFVQEVELGRFVRKLLATCQCTAVRIEPHRHADGKPSAHVFDVYRLE